MPRVVISAMSGRSRAVPVSGLSCPWPEPRARRARLRSAEPLGQPTDAPAQVRRVAPGIQNLIIPPCFARAPVKLCGAGEEKRFLELAADLNRPLLPPFLLFQQCQSVGLAPHAVGDRPGKAESFGRQRIHVDRVAVTGDLAIGTPEILRRPDHLRERVVLQFRPGSGAGGLGRSLDAVQVGAGFFPYQSAGSPCLADQIKLDTFIGALLIA